MMTTTNDPIEFIKTKLEQARTSLNAREESARVWRSGTTASWRAALSIHSTTAGKATSKSERLQNAEAHQRIANKIRHEIKMFEMVLGLISR